jgi:integrase
MPRPKLARPNYRLRRRGRSYVITWTDETAGTTRSVSTGQADERAAQIWRDQWIAGREQPPPPSEPLIGGILDGYLAGRLHHVASVETMTLSAKAVRRHVGNLEPRMLGRRTYMERRAGEGVSAGTIRRDISVLRAALAWAVRERWIDKGPYVEMPPRPPPRDRWLTRAEVERLIAACATPHLRLFVILAFHTAARRAAILELTWDRVDFDRRRIAYQQPGRRLTKKRRAVVPINAAALAALQEARILAVSDHVIEYRGQPIRSVKTGFAAACEVAGIADCSPHVLRHSAATHMVMAGVPLAEIARMLGDSEAMVEKTYGKHSTDYLRRAADALAGEPGLRDVNTQRS